MKPWLFDLLACPMDKYFPLKLYIFFYETKPEEFESFFDIYNQRKTDIVKNEKIIEIRKEDENILI